VIVYVVKARPNAPSADVLTDRATRIASAKFVMLESAWSARPQPSRRTPPPAPVRIPLSVLTGRS